MQIYITHAPVITMIKDGEIRLLVSSPLNSSYSKKKAGGHTAVMALSLFLLITGASASSPSFHSFMCFFPPPILRCQKHTMHAGALRNSASAQRQREREKKKKTTTRQREGD